MSPDISERAFEEAIERALLRNGPDALPGGAKAVRETPPPYGDDMAEAGGTAPSPPRRSAPPGAATPSGCVARTKSTTSLGSRQSARS
jgi:hypothetical protein